MKRGQRGIERLWAAVLVAALTMGCGDDPTGPAPAAQSDLLVLNSTGQSLAAFTVAESLSVAFAPVDLGASFDGDALDVWAGTAVSTVSSFGGSRVVFVDLGERSTQTAGFPVPEGDLANPSRPTFDETGTVWVAGRGSDAVYRVVPGESSATRLAERVGTFIERVLPVGEELWAIDANLDDDGLTFQPRGASRIVVLSRTGQTLRTITLPEDAPNARDAVLVGTQVIVLAGGTLDPETFAPRGDGALVLADVGSATVVEAFPLQGNGIGLELGLDGMVYVTSTADFVAIDVLRFDPAVRRFDRGPDDPLSIRAPGGGPLDCWTASALADGRLLCATFSFAESGRLLLADATGDGISETSSGFGTTDLHVLR